MKVEAGLSTTSMARFWTILQVLGADMTLTLPDSAIGHIESKSDYGAGESVAAIEQH